MDVEASHGSPHKPTRSKTMHRLLVAINCVILALGVTGGQLLSRLYYNKGGHRQWLSGWLQTGGWPLLLLPVAASYVRHRRARDRSTPVLLTQPRILLAAAGLDRADRGRGQLALRLGPRVPARLHLRDPRLDAARVHGALRVPHRAAAADARHGERRGAADGRRRRAGAPRLLRPPRRRHREPVLAGLRAHPGRRRAVRAIRAAGRAHLQVLVAEIQLVIGFVATAFCTVGMVANKDFQAIPREARQYELGEAKYYTVLAWSAVLWQCFFLGAVGVIFCVHTLLAGILIAVFIPVTEVAAVIFLHEKFSSEKGVALVLSLWGLASYSYGEWSEAKKKIREAGAAADAQPAAAP